MSYIRGGSAPTPPEKGSFPLDHAGECKTVMRTFLACLKEHGNKHHRCREHSKAYLECRMSRGLMAEEDLNELGFKHAVEPAEEDADVSTKERKGFLGGLTVKPVD